MLPIAHRKTYAMLALMLVCMLVAALLECQVHGASAAEHEHATPLDHQHGPASSASTHGACVLAVLPTAIWLGELSCIWFDIIDDFVPRIAPVFPPFIPPKTAASEFPDLACWPVGGLIVHLG